VNPPALTPESGTQLVPGTPRHFSSTPTAAAAATGVAADLAPPPPPTEEEEEEEEADPKAAMGLPAMPGVSGAWGCRAAAERTESSRLHTRREHTRRERMLNGVRHRWRREGRHTGR